MAMRCLSGFWWSAARRRSPRGAAGVVPAHAPRANAHRRPPVPPSTPGTALAVVIGLAACPAADDLAERGLGRRVERQPVHARARDLQLAQARLLQRSDADTARADVPVGREADAQVVATRAGRDHRERRASQREQTRAGATAPEPGQDRRRAAQLEDADAAVAVDGPQAGAAARPQELRLALR